MDKDLSKKIDELVQRVDQITNEGSDSHNEYNSARGNQGSGKQNPFADEFGVQKEGDSNQIQESYHDTGSGYMPSWTANNKQPIRLSIWDNSQVPGSAYMGRDRSQSPGEMSGGMGNPISRNNDDQTDWTEIDRLPSDFPEDPHANPNTQQGSDYVDEQMSKISPQIDKLLENAQQVTANTRRKPMDFKKVIAESKARLDKVYSIEEDYAAYGRYCGEPTCVGTWKELLGFEQRRALKIERESEVWRCPKCGKVTQANGSTAEQTSGPAQFNTYNSGQPATDEDFDAVNSIKPDTKRQLR